ncbi:MAG: hypothetical protein JWP48_1882 [Actinoallomurus sp.]|nr:hypothetical protein [Actinoallomurus sp.]
MTTTAPLSDSGRSVEREIHSGSPVESIAQHSESTAVTPVTARYGRSRRTSRVPPRPPARSGGTAGTLAVTTARTRKLTASPAIAAR